MGIELVTSRTALLVLVAGLAFGFGNAAPAQAPTLSVDAGSGQHAINPNIYGIANYGLNTAFAQEIKVPNIRWGGDGTTRYNWQVDSSNAGFDWYFMGGNGEASPVPSASADLMINTYKPASALMTIPIIPYVNSTSAWTCSFPTSTYGAQQSTNPYVHPGGAEDCGNSLTTANVQLIDSDILANHIANSVTLQQGWVQHLVSTFGTAANGGVPFYQLDNEPDGWSNTHRDIEPTQPPYSTIVSLGEQYATAVKQVDPTAMVFGPSDFTLGGWIGTPSAQNNLFAGQYYLQQFATYDQQNGTRSLDYFDEHYYPQFSSPATQLASTRTLWDPTYNGGTWVEQWYFYGPMQLIPRFHQWIGQYYPGTKLAFSEYSIDSGNKLITDALAEADVLGIFGQQGVDFANMWSPPAPTDPIAYAFRLFRNYDGAGGQFGSTGVSAVSSNPGNLSIYAAVRASDGALTIVVINKTTAAIGTSLSLANYTPGGTAAAYSYSNANLTQITAQGTTPIVGNAISYSFPAYSATVFVVESAQAAVITSPTPGLGTVLGTSNVAFQWTAGNGVSEYQLNVSATAAGASDLFLYKGTAISATAPSLPANAAKVYVRLYSKINGAWQYNDYVYTESGTPTPAVLTSPTPGLGTVLGTSNVVFQWTAGIDVSDYQLNLSAVAPGASDLYSFKGTSLSATALTLPANGVKVYARLYSKINGVWQYNDYVYTEGGTPTPATLTSPTPGLTTILGTSNVVFQWTAGTAVSVYQLNLSAIAPGESELYLYKGTATTATAPSLPANGRTVYATLWSYLKGAWQSNSYTFTASPTPAAEFTPLHLYYLSPTGSDSNSGTSASEPWATPDHSVDCGDVIVAAAGNYTNQFNQNWGTVSNCPSASGGIDGKGGIYFATLLCAGPDLEACQVNAGVNHFGFDIEQESNWAVEGFKATTDGADDSNQVTPAFDGACGGNKGPCNGVYHHFAFINDIAYNSADGFGPSGYDQQGIYGVDYLAIVGDIAQNSAQGNPNSWYCVAAIDIVAPANYDTEPGTHLYEYGNFSYNNQTNCPTDVENFMFDTWDANGYSNRGVAQNNMGWLSGRFGFNVFDQDISPTTATAFILNNTLYGSNQLAASAWANGDINIQNSSSSATSFWGGLTIQDNLVQENQEWPGGDSTDGYVYAFSLGGSYSNVTVGGSGSQNYFSGLATVCRGNACAPANAPYSDVSFGTAAELGTNYNISPAFNNPADLISNRSGTPNCSGFTNTTACMGYNANTHTLTNPSAIYDLQPSANGANSAGYQLPGTACVTSGPVYTYYPAWLKGVVYLHWNSNTQIITENTDLVTKPCGL